MNYYKDQAGHGLPGFQGMRFQRGHGLGGMFKGLLRLATPLLKKGAVELGKTSLRTGLSALGNKRPLHPRKRVSSSSVVKRTTSHKRTKKDIF